MADVHSTYLAMQSFYIGHKRLEGDLDLLSLGSGGSLPVFTENAIPYSDADGALTEDATGLSFDGNDLSVGHNQAGTYSGFYLNGGRASIMASLFGLRLNMGADVAANGTYDTSKGFRIQNRGNDLVIITTSGTGPYVTTVQLLSLLKVDGLKTTVTPPTLTGVTMPLISDENGTVAAYDLVSKNYANDAAAAVGGVQVGQQYHNAGAVRVRIA